MIYFALAALLTIQDTAAPPPDITQSNFRSAPDCDWLHQYDPGPEARYAVEKDVALMACRLPQPDDATEVAQRILGERRFGFAIEGHHLTIAARPNDGEQPELQGVMPGAKLDPTDEEGLFLSRFQMMNLQEGVLTFYLFANLQTLEEGESAQPIVLESWRGPDAPAETAFDPDLHGMLKEVEFWSDALGETRRLDIYTPPAFDPNKTYAAMFFADGSKVQYYARVIEPMILEGHVEPLVLIGARAGQAGIVEDRSDIHHDLRNADYIPGRVNQPPRFEQHMTFFADELVAHAINHYAVSSDPKRRAVSGRSSGGAFAFMAGYLRPDAFGLSFPMSGGWRLNDVEPATPDSAIFRLATGRYEMQFLARSRYAIQALESAGYDVQLNEISAGHTQEVDDYGLIPLLPEFFPGQRD